MNAPVAPMPRPAAPVITPLHPLPAGPSPVHPVSGITASAAAQLALARWITPDLPLYGNDHDRGDFAP